MLRYRTGLRIERMDPLDWGLFIETFWLRLLIRPNGRQKAGHPTEKVRDWSERNGQNDIQEVTEGRKEGRRQAGRCESGQTA